MCRIADLVGTWFVALAIIFLIHFSNFITYQVELVEVGNYKNNI